MAVQDIKDDRWTIDYAITITLHPSIRCNKTVEQYDTMKAIIRDYITDCCYEFWKKNKPTVQFQAPKVTLVAELTKSQDIHYHGIVTLPLSMKIRDHKIFIRDIFRYKPKAGPLRNDLKKYLGFIYVKEIDDNGWSQYLRKGFAEFEQSLDRKPILRDDHNIFTAEELLTNQ